MPLTDEGMDVIAFGLNDQQHGSGPKLSSADPHMLAAYCFDLTRKLHYMYMALRLESPQKPTFSEYNVSDLRSLAIKIQEETTTVENAATEAENRCGDFWTKECDWGVRARALEVIIQNQWRAIRADYQGLGPKVLK